MFSRMCAFPCVWVWRVELPRPQSHPGPYPRKTTFTSVDTDSTSLTSPGIVRAWRGVAARGINPWGCQTEVKPLRREAARNEARSN